MFYKCYNLQYIDMGSFSSASTDLRESFYEACRDADNVEIDLSNIDTQSISGIYINNAFSLCADNSINAKIKWSNNNATVAMPLIAQSFYNSKFITSGTNHKVYVPDHLYDTYKTMTNWSQVYAAGNLEYQSNW